MRTKEVKKIREIIDNMENSEGPVTFEFRQHKEGSELWKRATIQALRDEDDIITKLVAIAIDITEIKVLQTQLLEQNKQLLELDHMRSQFVNTAAHELRTPVTVIQGFLEIINMNHGDRIPDDVIRMLRTVSRNTERLTSLTNDLLDLQRIDAGELTFNVSKENINEIIISASEELEPYLSEKQHEYRINLADLEPLYIDPVRINQVIVNLIMNAIKYIPESNIIDISSWDDNDSVYVQIRDHGIGLTENDIDSLSNHSLESIMACTYPARG